MIIKDLNKLTDSEIIEYLINGDEQVTEYLFYEKCNSMFNYIIKEIFDYRVDKDELINELYLFLYKNNWAKIRKFEGRSKLTTWISVVAVRFFIRKRDIRIESPQKTQLSDKETTNIPDKISYNNFITNFDLYSAINKLKNPRDRFVIMAIDIEGKEEKEIAAALNVNIENLYNIKRRARKQLSNILKEYKYVN